MERVGFAEMRKLLADREWILNARRAVESDKRSLQKLLRTLGSHWKMRIQKEAGKSWLQLITPETFAQALDQDRNREGEVGEPEPEAAAVPGTMPAPSRHHPGPIPALLLSTDPEQ